MCSIRDCVPARVRRPARRQGRDRVASRGAQNKSTDHGLRNLVEGGRATLDPVHLVALLKQELGQVAAVLSCDACDECHLPRHRHRSWATQVKFPCHVFLESPGLRISYSDLLFFCRFGGSESSFENNKLEGESRSTPLAQRLAERGAHGQGCDGRAQHRRPDGSRWVRISPAISGARCLQPAQSLSTSSARLYCGAGCVQACLAEVHGLLTHRACAGHQPGARQGGPRRTAGHGGSRRLHVVP